MAISTDDYVSISDCIGRYFWVVDDGDIEAWVALWTEDGVMVGLTPEPLVGHDQIRIIPERAYAPGHNETRHMLANLHCDYGETRDVVRARYYTYISDWSLGGAPRLIALSDATLVRTGEGWKMKRNDSRVMRGG